MLCFICNLGCQDSKRSLSLYHAREILAPIWTRCPDRDISMLRWWTEIMVKVPLNNKTATPNTTVRPEQLHFVMNHSDIACLLTWPAPEPNRHRLFEKSRMSPNKCQWCVSSSFGLICNCLVALNQCFFISPTPTPVNEAHLKKKERMAFYTDAGLACFSNKESLCNYNCKMKKKFKHSQINIFSSCVFLQYKVIPASTFFCTETKNDKIKYKQHY